MSAKIDKFSELKEVSSLPTERWIHPDKYMEISRAMKFNCCSYSPTMGAYRGYFCGMCVPREKDSSTDPHEFRCDICKEIKSKGGGDDIIFAYVFNEMFIFNSKKLGKGLPLPVIPKS